MLAAVSLTTGLIGVSTVTAHAAPPPAPKPSPTSSVRLSVSATTSWKLVIAQGRLTRANGAPIDHAPVNVQVDQHWTWAGLTDDQGSWKARISVPADFGVGQHQITALYVGVDAADSATTTATFVRSTGTPTVVTASASPATVRQGDQVTFRGRLSMSTGDPVPNDMVMFATDPAGNDCTAVTGADGTYRVQCPVTQPVGRRPIAVTYAGGYGTAPSRTSVLLTITPGSASGAASTTTTPPATTPSADDPGDPEQRASPLPTPTPATHTSAPSTTSHLSDAVRRHVPHWSRRGWLIAGGCGLGVIVVLAVLGRVLLRSDDEDSHFID